MPQWPCVAQARSAVGQARVPLWLHREQATWQVGSLSSTQLAAVAGQDRLVRHDSLGVHWLAQSEAELNAAVASANLALHAQGWIKAWRYETFSIYEPRSLRRLGCMERAAARFWGTLTLGAHCTGYVTDAQGHPHHIWVAQRAANKAVDPNAFDNLIGAGVGDGQTPAQALLREAWEEAGLRGPQLAGVQPGRRIQMFRDVPEGLQFEQLFSFDLALPAGTTPVNQDGEVQRFECLPVAQALDLAASGAMTVDAALVMLDFALRHHLLPAADDQAMQVASAALWLEFAAKP